MPITVNQIANQCGVSRTTVLRALNGGSVSKEKKERILKVARENNYRPNLLARSLNNGRTMSIGVVTINIENIYFVQSLNTINKEADKKQLKEDDRFTYFENIGNLFVKQDITKSALIENDVLCSDLIYDLSHSSINDKEIIIDKTINSNITDIAISHDYGDTGGSQVGDESNGDFNGNPESCNSQNEEQKFLPIYNCYQNHVTNTINGTLEGIFFLGIMVSRDACINFYNVIANSLNNQVTYSASGVKGPVAMIIESLKLLAPAATMATVTSALTFYFSGLWNTFISMFSVAAGPIDWIVGAITALIGAACISTLVTMFIMGYQKKGFAVGWKVHDIFNWEWYCGEAN